MSTARAGGANKRIVVTGGAGFIGSHLCRTLLDAGNEVLCVDNFFTGSRRNIAPLLDRPGFSLLTRDVVEPLAVDADEIYNLACPASPVHYQLDPIATMKTNIMGAITVLDLARRTGATVLQASTSEVYGDPLVHPQPESYLGNVNTIGPRSCYDEGKRAAETLFFDYHRQHGVPIKLIRIFNTYGPNMHPEDGRVVSNFVVQALRGQDITIYGDGSQTRSFCYVDDMVGAMTAMMASDGALTGPINVGNPVEFSIGALARLVIDMVGSRSRIVYRPLPIDDPRQRRPDISQAQLSLGWEPKVQLREGLAKTIAYFDRRLAAPAPSPARQPELVA